MIARFAKFAAPSLLALTLGLGSLAAASPALSVAGMGTQGIIYAYDGGEDTPQDVYFQPEAFGFAAGEGLYVTDELEITSVKGADGLSLTVNEAVIRAFGEDGVPVLRISLLADGDGATEGTRAVEVTFKNTRTGAETTATLMATVG